MTTSIDELAPLRDYVAAKYQVAGLVTDAHQVVGPIDGERAAAIADLVVKLAEDRFNMAVVGQFKRGKSSLMNAVIGRELLPTGVLPLTSAITAVCYGPREGVWLRRRDSRFEQEIGTEELTDWVTERGNPGNEKGLVEARVEVPHPFLRRGLYFVDTPGVGSASLENTETAFQFLSEADAVIFVTGVDSPLGGEEERFLRHIREQVSRLIIVVNKVDTVGEEERQEVLAYIGTRVAGIIGRDDVPVFPVSARIALESVVNGSHARDIQSGVPELERALSEFLANEQGRTFLLRTSERTIAILEPVAATSPAENRDEVASLLARAMRVREQLLGTGPLALAGGSDQPSTDAAVLEDAVKAGTDAVRAEPNRRRRTAGCPICAFQSQAVFEFFVQWQHRLATDRRAQRAFAAAGGFCPAHTWQFQQLGAPQDLSVGYAPLVEKAQREVARAIDEPPVVAAARLRSRIQDRRDCRACHVLVDAERTSISACLDQLERHADPSRVLDKAWCLAHIRAALATEPTTDIARRLTSAQAEQLQETLEDMQGYGLKRAAVRKGIINAREADAWRRALIQLVGERSARGTVLGGDDAGIG